MAGGAAGHLRGGRRSQTIYSFTGATSDYLLKFRQRYPEADVVKLVRDYRSTPEVVALANKILATRRIETSVPDRMVTWPEPLELIAQREHGPEPEFFEASDDAHEAEEVAQRIKALLSNGQDVSEIAILYRTNGQSEAFEQALTAHSIPYVMRGAERFFSRTEVKEGMLALRAALHVESEIPAPRWCATCFPPTATPPTRRLPAGPNANAGNRSRRWCVWPMTWPPPATREASRLPAGDHHRT